MAVIKVESYFVPEAHSGVAGGLMQLTEETAEWNAKELGITTEYDCMDPETNIARSTRNALKILLKTIPLYFIK